MEKERLIRRGSDSRFDILKDEEGYVTRDGERIETFPKYLVDITGMGLQALEWFFDLLWTLSQASEDSELEKIVHVGSTLVSNLKDNIAEFDDFSGKHCGDVVIDKVVQGPVGVPNDTMLGARFIKAKPKSNVVDLKTAKGQ